MRNVLAKLARYEVGCALFLAAPIVNAQQEANGAPLSTQRTASVASAPRPLEFVEAVSPVARPGPRRRTAVDLNLTIGAEGHVTEAEVVGSAGAAFDEAARKAASQLIFSPAIRSSVPVSVRTKYRFNFVAAPHVAAPNLQHPGPLTDEAQLSDADEPIEVTVRGDGVATRLEQSAQSVKVVEMQVVQRQAIDLGEVLARNEGIGVQRSGGVGSDTRFSLNGLSGEKIQFFVDGLPMELSGYPNGIANVPVNLVERVEIYSGVVPIRFGADALGGAVNLVTKRDVPGTHASASYGVGSFSSHRVTVGAQHLLSAAKLHLRVDAFADGALNRYPINVEAADDKGRLQPIEVPRFHDRYFAAGVRIAASIVRRPWVRRLTIRAFASGNRKEHQHNAVMTVPYGGLNSSQGTYGANLTFQKDWGQAVSLDLAAGYSRKEGHLLNVDPCVYSWLGECVFENRSGAEGGDEPSDERSWSDSSFARLHWEWSPAYDQALRISVAPTLVSRSGRDRLVDPNIRSQRAPQEELATLVSGLEYEVDLFDEKVESIAFVKHYGQFIESKTPIRAEGAVLAQEKNTQNVGAGTSLRYRILPWLDGKLAYEWATRLPRPVELFGDGVFTLPNLELLPEQSHNLNVSALLDFPFESEGRFRVTANLFLREMHQLVIRTQEGGLAQRYGNVFGASSQGVEGSAAWTSAQRLVGFDANITYQEVRNTSTEGVFGSFEGQRIPNRPYFFANASAHFTIGPLAAAHDELAVSWHSRYVKGFFRSWELIGLRESKLLVPDQLVHSVSLVYFLDRKSFTFSSSLEIQNVSNERVFDVFGAQRPGREFLIKTTLEY